MKPFQKILVPTDFSPGAEEATRIAVDLSRCYDASLRLIHVYEPPTYALPDGGLSFTTTQLDAAIELTGAHSRTRAPLARDGEASPRRA